MLALKEMQVSEKQDKYESRGKHPCFFKTMAIQYTIDRGFMI